MKCHYSLILLFLLIGCREPSPSFNPFDPVFDVNIDLLQKDSTLKLIGDCMAYGYFKNFGAYETYYTFYTYLEGEDSIVGKGMNILLGTKVVKLDTNLELLFMDSILRVEKNEIIDSIKKIPIDTAKVDSILNIFQLTRKEVFIKVNKEIGAKEYFMVCTDSVGKEYLFENQFEHMWLSSGRIIGQRRLHFDTQISRSTLFYETYY